MTWQIKYLPEAEDDLAALNQSVRPQILKGIRKVAQNPGYPDGYGKPLGNFAGSNLAGLYKIKFKKAGLRVVYALQKQDEIMTIIIISARADDLVYYEAERRRKRHKILEVYIMECGKLTAKLRDAVPVCFIEDGKEVKRFKNIEIPDEIKRLPYQDFEFSVPVSGAITFKITFEEGILPKVWPEARTRKTRKIKLEEAPVPEHITAGLQAALEQAEAEGQPMAEIAEAAAQGAEITTELNGQELTITAHETENMEAAFNVTGERRKALVEAVKAFIDAPAVYQNAPSFAYVIGDYTVSKTGTVSGPANEALMAALNAKGFIAE